MSDGLRTAGTIAVVAAWFGAALITAASVAPAAFAALPTRAMAGDVVGRVLPVVFIAGIAAGVIACVVTAQVSRPRAILSAVIAGACIIAQFVIGPRIARLRADIGPSLDALPAGDARRALFGRLHAYSVGWMGVAMLAAAIVLTLSLLALRQRPSEL
jgi:hypothetical protein